MRQRRSSRRERVVVQASPFRPLAEHARIRVFTSLKAMLLASTAAALAWWLAHDVLGHSQPFFAPSAAAISLTTSRLEPSARIGQMVGGVLLGILIGEAGHDLLDSSPVALGGLTAARRAAHLNARAVPRWWLQRAAIDAEIRRSEELDLLAISVFGVMRLAVTMPRDTGRPSSLCAAIAEVHRELAGAGD